MDIINQSSSATLEVKFYAPDGSLATPSAIHFHIEDKTRSQAGTILRTATATPASIVDLPIEPSDNAITDATMDNFRRLVVKAIWETGQIVAYYDWQVRNIGSIPT